MEYEVRYYYPAEKLGSIIEKLKSIKELKMESRCYEKAEQSCHFYKLKSQVQQMNNQIEFTTSCNL